MLRWLPLAVLGFACDGGDRALHFDNPVPRQATCARSSHTRFRYTNSDAAHRFSNLIGGEDKSGARRGQAQCDLSSQIIGPENVDQRMPRVRYGKVHVFNNYFHSPGNTYAIAAALESNLRIDNNYFEDTDVPHQFFSDNGTAVVTATGNVYDGSSGDRDQRGSAFTPPYAYPLDPAADIADAVESAAGPH